MTISTAEVLESNTSLSEFTADPATPVPATPVPVTPTIPVQQVRTERAVTAKRRRVRVDWYTLAVILLMLASAALGVYRLAWAMQP